MIGIDKDPEHVQPSQENLRSLRQEDTRPRSDPAEPGGLAPDHGGPERYLGQCDVGPGAALGNGPIPSGEALKFDDGKTPYDLIDPLLLRDLALVLQFGARKYAEWNWAKGTFKWSRLYSATQRHLQDFWNGQEYDEETGLPVLAHAMCELMFLHRYHHDGLGTDNRPHTFLQPLHKGEGPERSQIDDYWRGSG